MTTVKAEKILVFGSLSYGNIELNTSPSNPPLSGFSELTWENNKIYYPQGSITYIILKTAPRFIDIGILWKKIVLFGEASFINPRILPESSYTKYGIPNFLTDQI